MPLSNLSLVVLVAGAVTAAAFTVPVPDHGTASSLPIAATAVTDGHPATWGPCATIGYTLNLTDAPPGAGEDVQDVMGDVSAHTGIRFADEGLTTRVPQPGDLADGPRWAQAPLTIAWAHQPSDLPQPGQSQLLSEGGDVAGKTVTTTEYRPRRGLLPARHRIVAADVVIDTDLRSVGTQTWGGRSGQRAFIEHELLHALGLDHSAHAGSIMAPSLLPGAYRALQPWDLAALTALTGTCQR